MATKRAAGKGNGDGLPALPPRSERSRQTILVADDESGIREMYVELLNDMGYKVLAAADGDEAHKMVRSKKIDLAFIDIWMPPGIDGIELIKKWKKEGLLLFPVAVVSGYADVKWTVEAMKAGAKDVLTKPVPPKTLEDFVRKHVAIRAGALFAPVVKDLKMGESQTMLALAGEMFKAVKIGGPITFVGSPRAGCEYFGLLLHPPGKPWINAQCGQLGNNPAACLDEARNGSIFVKSLAQLGTKEQQGLLQLIRNAEGHGTNVFVEVDRPLAELEQAGTHNETLLKILKNAQVQVPEMSAYENDVMDLLRELAPRLPTIEGCAEAKITDDALREVFIAAKRWRHGGLDALAGVLRILMRSATDNEVSLQQIGDMFNSDKVGEMHLRDNFLDVDLRQARVGFERLYFARLLERVNNNFSEAAKLSGLERTYLYRKVKTLLGDDAFKSIQ